jgi:hypothetical protein
MGGIRLKTCKFDLPSTNKIRLGSWTPINPDFHPFVDLEEFCIPCYRWRFLQLIRGSFPRWSAIIRTLNGNEFDRYYSTASKFKEYTITLLRMLARSTFPDSIINFLSQPEQLLDQIRGNSQPDELDLASMSFVSSFLFRLFDENRLQDYKENDNLLFNIQVICERFDLFRNDESQIRLRARPRTTIGSTSRSQSQESLFRWIGPLALVGEIPILDLEKKEIRSVELITDNFFDPPIDFSNQQNIPPGIFSLFIEKEFHKLWILRESLAQLSEDGRLSSEIQDVTGDRLFSPHRNLNSENYRDYQIVVETLDHTLYADPSRNFRLDTGQAAIIHNLLYTNYPGITNIFQDCIMRLGTTNYTCPIQGNMGCGMGDRRVRNQSFPRDRVETNVYKFLRYLRDESIFKHRLFYVISRFYPAQPLDLNEYGKFWIGNIYFDANQNSLFFRSQMPASWNSPSLPSEKPYEIVLLSPICFERGFKVRFRSREGNEFTIEPIQQMNPWSQEAPFVDSTQTNPLRCIIGEFSIDDNLVNIQRQKKKLVKAIQFSSRIITQRHPNDPIAQADAIMQQRFQKRAKRTGLATFGRYVRFV